MFNEQLAVQTFELTDEGQLSATEVAATSARPSEAGQGTD